jgi:hypothetical protein
LKIGKTLGVGTALVQRVLMEQPRPFDVDVAEAAFASQWNGAHRLRVTVALMRERNRNGSAFWPPCDFYSFRSGVIDPVASSGKAWFSVVVVEPLSSGPAQSPTHSFVPRTVPTNLQPIGAFDFTWTSALSPTLGGELWANTVPEKQIAMRMNSALIQFTV